MDISSSFWDKMAKRYAARPVSDVASWEATLERTRSYLGPEKQVIEFGCGTGSSALKLAGAAGHILATDYAPNMIEIARGKRGDVTNVDFEVGDFSTAKGQYDVLIAFNMLYLLPDLAKAMDQAFAVTKPGGVFISKSMCLGDGMNYLKPAIWVMQQIGKAPPVDFLTSKALDQVFVNAGYVLEVADMIPAKSRNRFIVARRP